jgi:Co/Zn/Cd efflux system component
MSHLTRHREPDIAPPGGDDDAAHADQVRGGGLGRLWREIGQTFGGHSHDAAEPFGAVLESDAAGRRTLLISLAGLAVTAVLQAAVVTLSASVGLLGDTLHNFVDALTAVPLLVALRLARKPATPRYAYGYGRVEDLAHLLTDLSRLTAAIVHTSPAGTH